MKTSKLFFLMLILIGVFNCANDSEDDFIEPDTNPNSDAVTYVDNVASVMSSSCVGCHSSPPVNGAPFALVNFSQVSQRANGIFQRMNLASGSAGAMPPSGKLPQSTVDLIKRWIDTGKKEK